MSQPDLAVVRWALNKHLQDELGDDLPVGSIAWENRVFTPPPLYDPLTKLPNIWVRETLFVISEDNRDLVLHEVRGRTLYEVFCPVGGGTERPEALRKRIVDAFEKKRSLTNQPNVAVGIEKVTRGDPRTTDALWLSVPASVYWRVYAVATANRTT